MCYRSKYYCTHHRYRYLNMQGLHPTVQYQQYRTRSTVGPVHLRLVMALRLYGPLDCCTGTYGTVSEYCTAHLYVYRYL